MSTDPQDRLLDALTESNKAKTTLARRLESLERRCEGMETMLAGRVEKVEQEMGSSNAHLDNLIREFQLLSKVIGDEAEDRKTEETRRHKIEDEDRDLKRQSEKEDRDLKRKAGAELWSMFKQPLGFLIAGLSTYLIYEYFQPPSPTTSSVEVIQPSEP